MCVSGYFTFANPSSLPKPRRYASSLIYIPPSLFLCVYYMYIGHVVGIATDWPHSKHTPNNPNNPCSPENVFTTIINPTNMLGGCERDTSFIC